MRRVDHAGSSLVAGAYTSVALISLGDAWRTTVLAVVWSGAFAAALCKFCWVAAPRWLWPRSASAVGSIGPYRESVRQRRSLKKSPPKKAASEPPSTTMTICQIGIRLHPACRRWVRST